MQRTELTDSWKENPVSTWSTADTGIEPSVIPLLPFEACDSKNFCELLVVLMWTRFSLTDESCKSTDCNDNAYFESARRIMCCQRFYHCIEQQCKLFCELHATLPSGSSINVNNIKESLLRIRPYVCVITWPGLPENNLKWSTIKTLNDLCNQCLLEL